MRLRLIRPALLAALLATSACVSGESAAPAGPSVEAQRGRAYAEDVCSTCHAIDPGADFSPDPQAPAFQVIADTPGMTRIALSAWFQGAHENMPQLMVEQDRIDDLWAYLSSLKQR